MGMAEEDSELDLYGDGSDLTEHEILGIGDNRVESTVNGVKKEVEEEANGEDLFEAALTEGVDPHQSTGSTPNSETGSTRSHIRSSSQQFARPRRFCCYIGNMTWWTTDQDLASLISEIGIIDLVDVKFYDNRITGQSKGFALGIFATDASVQLCMEKLPRRKLHGHTLIVLAYGKQSLDHLEAMVKRPGIDRGDKPQSARPAGPVFPPGNEPERERSGNFLGTVRLGGGPPPQMMAGPPPPGVMPQQQPIVSGLAPPGTNFVAPPIIMNMPPGGQMQMGPPPNMQLQRAPGPPPPMMMPQGANVPPPGFVTPNSGPPGAPGPPIPVSGAPPHMMMMNRSPMVPMAGPPPGAHINPNVYPGAAAAVGGGMPVPPQQQQPPPASMAGMPPSQGQVVSEAEFEEIMNRNRTVSSSAISRAVSDAAAGDYASAIETLVTAISLIRQSRVADDTRCRVLITSLQDTLHGIEAKSYSRRSGGKERPRERSRSRERPPKRHRRSRSRSHTRERQERHVARR